MPKTLEELGFVKSDVKNSLEFFKKLPYDRKIKVNFFKGSCTYQISMFERGSARMYLMMCGYDDITFDELHEAVNLEYQKLKRIKEDKYLSTKEE